MSGAPAIRSRTVRAILLAGTSMAAVAHAIASVLPDKNDPASPDCGSAFRSGSLTAPVLAA